MTDATSRSSVHSKDVGNIIQCFEKLRCSEDPSQGADKTHNNFDLNSGAKDFNNEDQKTGGVQEASSTFSGHSAFSQHNSTARDCQRERRNQDKPSIQSAVQRKLSNLRNWVLSPDNISRTGNQRNAIQRRSNNQISISYGTTSPRTTRYHKPEGEKILIKNNHTSLEPPTSPVSGDEKVGNQSLGNISLETATYQKPEDTKKLTENKETSALSDYALPETTALLVTEDDKAFYKRKGATNKGHHFEDWMVAYLTLNLIRSSEISDFAISANDSRFGNMDDIVLDVHRTTGAKEKYAMQLKYADSKHASLTRASLKGTGKEKKGKLSIHQFFLQYQKLIESLGVFKFILCTNRVFKITKLRNGKLLDEMTLNSGKDMIKVKIVPSDLELKAVDPLATCNCYKFQIIESESTVTNGQKLVAYKLFLENFILVTNYMEIQHIERKMKADFKNYSHRCDTFLNFLRFIEKWSQKKGKKTAIYKSLANEVIALLLLSPHIKTFPHSDEKLHQNEELFKRAIHNFQTTVIDKDHFEKVSTLWAKMLSEGLDVTALPRLAKYQIVPDADGLKQEEITKALWLEGKCPLVVEDHEDVQKAIGLCQNANLKFAILGNSPATWTLSDLQTKCPDFCDNILEKYRYVLQGNEISLKTLVLLTGEELLKAITPNELLCLVSCVEGDDRKKELPPSYINRHVSKTINSEFLNNIGDDNLVLISGDFKGPHIHDKNILRQKSRIFACPEDYSNEKLDILVEGEKYHHFRWFQGNLEWIKSTDDTSELKKYQLEKHYIPESELLRRESENSINLICDEPGMGKTSLMKNIQYLNSTNIYWTIIIYTKNHFLHFQENKTGNLETFKEYIWAETCKKLTEFEKLVMKMFMKKKLVRYVWDGLDEISRENLQVVTVIIEKLRSEGKQWLNSRTNLRDTLEERFHVIAKTLKRFGQEDQEQYVERRLQNSTSGVSKRFLRHDFLEIPLQIFILTELLLQDPEKYKFLIDQTFTVPDLYKYFIDERLDLYYKDRLNLNYETNDALNRKILKEKTGRFCNYEKVAALIYFEDIISQETRYDIERFLSEIDDQDDFGIIKNVTKDKNVEFFHTSVGEYFAVSYLVKNINKIGSLENCIFADDNIRHLFDVLVSDTSKAHQAVIRKDYDLLKSCTDYDLNIKDKVGRSALHLAAANATSYTVLRIENISGTYIVDDRTVYWQQGLNSESFLYKKIFKHLLKKSDHNEIDSFGLDCFSYALRNNCFYAISHLKENKEIKSLDVYLSALYYCIRFDYDNMFNGAEKLPFIRSKHFNKSLLFVAVYYNSVKSLGKILANPNNGHYRQIVEESEEGLLTEAVKRKHNEIMKILIDNGAQLGKEKVISPTRYRVKKRSTKYTF